MINTTFDFGKIAKEYDAWYDTPQGKKIDEIEKKLFIRYLKKIPYKHIVEISAGTGHWTQLLSQQGKSITATDISENMLQVANSKNIDNTVFLKTDATNLPFVSNSVDVVVAITSIEFVMPKYKALEEINRILKPGGFFLIGTLNRNGSLEQIRRNNEVFANANFYTYKTLVSDLMKIGKLPMVEGCLLLPNPMETSPDKIEQVEKIADPRELNEKGNFLVGLVQKNI